MQWIESLDAVVNVLNNWLWGYVLIAMLLILGLWFSFRTGFVQLTAVPEMARLVTEGVGAKPRAGHISTFQAFCVSTASRVGVGNIAGIAIAVVLGGPGAVFWMWVIATIGAATGFVESTLGQIYKVPKAGGGFLGGPAYYIRNVLGSKFFAGLFAVLISITYGLIFNSVQCNTMSLSIQTSWGIEPLYTGLVVAVLTAVVIFGGLVRVARVVGVMVPFMAGAYILVAIFFTFMHIDKVPGVLTTIVTSAFDFDAVYGASFAMIVMTGIKRGLFSNEAGMGAIPNAASTADASHPVKQGLVQAFGVFFDTIVVCTASAMIVLVSSDWQTAGKTGIALVQHSLARELGVWMNHFISIVVLFFAFSSIIGNYFYGEVNMPFVSRHPAALNVYRALVVLVTFSGAVLSLSTVWNLADLFMALMALVNLVAITLLGKYAFAALADYRRQQKAGTSDPEFDPSVLPDMRGVQAWPRHREEEIEQA
ncbi:MAG: alanine/glycine:cation symporter family protein [Duodenibacillus sp.]